MKGDKTEIVCNIYDPYRDVVRKWASVRRTLEQAASLCDLIAEGNGIKLDSTIEQANHTAKELEAIIPMLEHLHTQVREKLWIAESASTTPVVWPYDSEHKCWSVVVDCARRRGDKAICTTDGATYILGDPATFQPLPNTMKFKLGKQEVMLVSIDGGGRVRWVVRKDSFDTSDKLAIKFFGLS